MGQPIRAQAPDGTIHEFPEGTDAAVIDSAMKKYITGLNQPTPPADSYISQSAQGHGAPTLKAWKQAQLGNVGGNYVSPMFDPENPTFREEYDPRRATVRGMGVARGAIDDTIQGGKEILDLLPIVKNSDWSQARDKKYLQDEKRHQFARQYAGMEDEPETDRTIANLATSLAIPAGPIMRGGKLLGLGMEKATQWAPKFISSLLGTGTNLASQGAAYSMLAPTITEENQNRSYGDLSNAKINQAIDGALLNLGLGGAGLLGTGAVKAASGVGRIGKGKFFGKSAIPEVAPTATTTATDSLGAKVQTKIQKAIEKAATRDKQSIDDLIEKLKNSDDELSLLELSGPNMRDLGRGVTTSPGEAKIVAEKFFEGRDYARPDRTMGYLDEAFGKGTATQNIENLASETSAKSKPLYEAFYATDPIKFKGTYFEDFIKTDTGKELLRAARAENKRLADAGIEQEDLFLKLVDNNFQTGKFESRPVPTAYTIDMIKRAIDSKVGDAVDATGKLTSQGRHWDQVRRKYLDEIDAIVPQYKESRAPTEIKYKLQNATELGRDFRKGGITEDAVNQFKRLSDEEKEAFKKGFQEDLATALNNAPDSSDIYKVVFGSPDKRERMRQVLGEDAFASLESKFAKEKKMHETKRHILGGSQTANKLAVAEDSAIDGAKEAVSAAFSIATGGYGQLIPLVFKFAKKFSRGNPEEVEREVAKILFNPNRDEVIKYLDGFRAASPPPTPPMRPMISGLLGAPALLDRER